MVEINEDVELRLLHGLPIKFGELSISSPRIIDIVDSGYSSYNKALSTLLFDKDRNPQLRYMKQSNLDFIIYFFEKDDDFRESFLLGLKLMFNDSAYVDTSNEPPLFYIGRHQISDEALDSMQRLIKFVNKVPDKYDEEFNPANSKAEEFVKKILGDRAKKPQKKPVNNLHSLVSALAWKHDLSVLDGNLTIYQFYDGYFRLENIDHYNNIMTGIYSGSLDSSKVKIQENTWTKILI
ncbi:hypothetical protein D3C75_557230 [compost metagenome]